MRGVNHAGSLGAVADTRRCRYVYQGHFSESLYPAQKYRGLRSARRPQILLWGLALALVLLCPGVAHALTAADMGVVWGPNPVAHQGSGRLDEGVICIADNAYNAALVTCGVMTNDERLTADAKAKLSNESTGGSFYTLSSSFHCFQGEDGYNYPDWVSNPYGLIEGFSYMYGNSSVWWARYASNLLASAKEDLETILAGGSLGGGSGGGESGQVDNNINLRPCAFTKTDKTGTGNKVYRQYNINYYNYSPNETIAIAGDMRMKFTDQQKNYLNNNMGDNVLLIYTENEERENYGSDGQVSYYVNTFTFRIMPKEYVNVSKVNVNIHGETQTMDAYLTLGKTGESYTSKEFSFQMRRDLNSLEWYSNSSFAGLRNYNRSDVSNIAILLLYDGSWSGNAPVPPTQWPETEPTTPTTKPVVPDPPDVTAPDVPTYEPKSYTNPVTTTNTGDTYNSTTINNYTYNYDTYQATGEDVIPYLQAILNAINALARNLSAYMLNVQTLINNVITSNNNNASQIVAKLQLIVTAINNACTTINSGIGELDTDINTGLGEIYELIGDFDSDVHKEFRSLKTYLKSLFQWLANQFDFTFDGGDFDDSSILYWLRRIYYKLGAGRVNTRPTDPVADPVGIGDWLAQLFRNFVGALLGIGGDALDAVLDALDDLRSKFPFSIPWDLAAILSLFIAEPIAPEFDVPQYTITNEGLQQVATYHIDLSVFDPYMVGIRTVETLVFAFCLAFKTDFFKGLLTVHKGE